MTIHTPLTSDAGGYMRLANVVKSQLEHLNFNPPDLSLLLSVPQDNVSANVQFTMWEATRLVPMQIGILNTRKLIIVPNEQDANDFRACGIVPEIKVCPLFCDGHFASYPAMRPFRFLHVGSDYGIPERKRQHDIITAFQSAFPTEADVELVIKRSKNCLPLNCFDKRVTVIAEKISDKELNALYGNCHVGIFPGGMESWGLPIGELAATGRPSITPLYRGPAEFLTPDSAFALPYSMERAPERCFLSHGFYAHASMDGMIHAMREAYRNPHAVYSKGLAAAQRAGEYTPERFGIRLRNILQEYVGKSGTRLVTRLTPDHDRKLVEAKVKGAWHATQTCVVVGPGVCDRAN
jgi:glycosyltransferase involved in cell wall biosynthesis